MGTRDLTHKAIAEALSNDRLLTHDQRAALLTLVADDSVWQRKHDELAATALRSADHLRKAIKAEAEIERLRLKCQEHRDGRLAALERVATLERTLQEVGDLAASSATGPAQLESLKMIESIPPPWLRFSMAAAPAPAR